MRSASVSSKNFVILRPRPSVLSAHAPVVPSACSQVGDEVVLNILRSGEGGDRSGVKDIEVKVTLQDEMM